MCNVVESRVQRGGTREHLRVNPGAVYLFHGEEWHGGWPLGHLKAQPDACNQRGNLYSVLYQKT